MGHPLLNKQVAVTRTRDGSSALSDLLRSRGANVLEVPLIRFEDTTEPDALHARLRDLGNRDLNNVTWLALSSNQAVSALFAHLSELGLDARALSGVKLAAVGPSTARSLAEHGLRADFVPRTPGARHLGAELPADAGQTVLHLTSQVAEAELREALLARGLTYERAELYRTVPAVPTENELERLKAADVVTLASGSAARHLAKLAGTDFRVAAMGPQTAEAAREVGFGRIWQADTASLEALAGAAAEAVRDA